MGLILLLPAIALVLLPAILFTALLKPRCFLETAFSVILFSFANIVLVSQIAGYLSRLNSPLSVLSAHAVIALISLFLWNRFNRPGIRITNYALKLRFDNHKFFDTARKHPDLFILGLGVSAAIIFGFYLVITVPFNMDDVLTCYMARIGFWLQFGSFEPWPTQADYSGYACQTIYPMNTELLMFWTILFYGNGTFAGIVQWFSLLVSMMAIYGLSRFIGATRISSLFVSLIWPTFPAVLLQMTQGLTDLTFTSFFLVSLYFMFVGLKTKRKTCLALSAASFGLAFGTKLLIFFVLPGLGMTLVLIWLCSYKGVWRHILFWCACCIVAIGIVGSYIYVQNYRVYGHPLGPQEFIAVASWAGNDLNILERLYRFKISSIIFLFNFADVSLLPLPLKQVLFELKITAVNLFDAVFDMKEIREIMNYENILYKYGHRIQDGVGWYGPVGFFVAAVSFIINIKRLIKERSPYPAGMIAIATMYMLLVLYFKKWFTSVAMARYAMIPVVLLLPLFARLWDNKGKIFRLVQFIMIVGSLYFMFYTILLDGTKPLIGKRTIFQMSPSEKVTHMFHKAYFINNIIMAIEKNVPDKATIGFMVNRKFPVSLLFGDKLTRIVIPIYPAPTSVSTDFISYLGIDYLLTDSNLIFSSKQHAKMITKLAKERRFTLWRIDKY